MALLHPDTSEAVHSTVGVDTHSPLLASHVKPDGHAVAPTVSQATHVKSGPQEGVDPVQSALSVAEHSEQTPTPDTSAQIGSELAYTAAH